MLRCDGKGTSGRVSFKTPIRLVMGTQQTNPDYETLKRMPDQYSAKCHGHEKQGKMESGGDVITECNAVSGIGSWNRKDISGKAGNLNIEQICSLVNSIIISVNFLVLINVHGSIRSS